MQFLQQSSIVDAEKNAREVMQVSGRLSFFVTRGHHRLFWDWLMLVIERLLYSSLKFLFWATYRMWIDVQYFRIIFPNKAIPFTCLVPIWSKNYTRPMSYDCCCTALRPLSCIRSSNIRPWGSSRASRRRTRSERCLGFCANSTNMPAWDHRRGACLSCSCLLLKRTWKALLKTLGSKQQQKYAPF